MLRHMYVCSLDATSGGMRRGSPRKYQRRRGRCCSVRHMGEHAIARVHAFASWRVYRLVIHRRNVHRPFVAHPSPRGYSNGARSALRDHPPLVDLVPGFVIRSISTHGRIWYQARHSWYFRKFDALPMSRGRGMRGRIALR
jgi:hypothetical protein